MRTLSRVIVAAAALVVAGCTSSPTPHPQQGDTADGTPDTAPTAGAAPRDACAALGGTWESDDGVCEGLEADFGEPAGAQDAAPPPTADVVGLTVSATAAAGAVAFQVSVASDDVDCGAYADWWEVVRQDGTLVTRRLTGAPHVEDQPWSDVSAPVALDAAERVVIRAHFSTTGYGGQVWAGSLDDGFTPTRLGGTFADGLATAEPQPEGCAP